LWDAPSLSGDFPDPEPCIHKETVTATSLSSDGWLLASSCSDYKSIHILDAHLGLEMMPLEGHEGEVECVTFSPCGNLIASSSINATVYVWHVLSGAESLVLLGHKGFVVCVSFSHDGQQIALRSADMTVHLWNTTSGAQIFPALHNHNRYCHGIAFSPDGDKPAIALDP
jgi:WD40 repeat protein